VKHLQVTPFHIDPACGCNFVKKQEWCPDNWSTLVEQNQQQSIQGYEMIYLFWPRNQPFFSHIDPSRQETQVIHHPYFIAGMWKQLFRQPLPLPHLSLLLPLPTEPGL